MIQSEGQRLAAMQERQQEWWNTHTDDEKEKALGMSIEQAKGWWAVADLDSRDRVVAAYELAHPAKEEGQQEAKDAEEKANEETQEPEAQDAAPAEETADNAEAQAEETPANEEEVPADDTEEGQQEEEAPKKGRKSSKK